MNKLIRYVENRHVLNSTRDSVAGALAKIEQVKAVRWVLEILEAARQVAATYADGWAYASRDRRQFRSIVHALASGDGESRLCAQACRYIHDSLLTTLQDKQQFATWVVFAYQVDSHALVSRMASDMRKWVAAGYSVYSRSL